MIPSCLFAPWVVPVLGGPGAVGLPSGALPHGLRPVSAPARLSQDTWFDTWLDFMTVTLMEWFCNKTNLFHLGLQVSVLPDGHLGGNIIELLQLCCESRIWGLDEGLEWITILVFVLPQGAVMVFGDSDYVGMVMIMFRNTGDYQWDGNDNVPQHWWWLSILWLGAVCAGGLWLHSSRANLNIFIFCNR